MGHRFIFPVQFGIENRSGINLQSSDQRKDNFPGWIRLAILNVHDRPNFHTRFLGNLTLGISEPKPSIPYNTA